MTKHRQDQFTANKRSESEMITVIDHKILAILVLVGLLISRFQVQVLVGPRFAGNLKLSATVSKSHRFLTRFSISKASGSKYPLVVLIRSSVWATAGHAPDSHPVSAIRLPLLPEIHARILVLFILSWSEHCSWCCQLIKICQVHYFVFLIQ